MKHPIQKLLRFGAAAVAALSFFAGDALATEEWNNCVQTPEIDPAYLGGALVLLFGGILILTDRQRSRAPRES